ncbi:MAG: peptidylprolyl isomerase, partial [Thiohalophilus sp.]
YQDNRDRFMIPEQVSIDYIDLDLKKLSKQYEVSQQEVEEYYAAHRNNFIDQPERHEVSHILIAVNAERTQEQALALAQELAKKLDQGADFSKLAREYSDDPGSAPQGGKLGPVQPGTFVPEFESAALALKQGAISKPVKTQFGYHLIRADVVKPATIKPLAKVEEQIRQELRMHQAEQEFYEKVDALSRYSYEMPDSLQGVAEQVGLKVEQSSMFTRQGGKGLTSEPKVVNAAFSEDVLKTGRNSEVLELSDTRYLVLRINQHEPARARPLEEVKQEIVLRLKQQQAQQLAIKSAEEIKSALSKGEPAARVAAEYKVDWQNPGFIERRPGKDEKLDIRIRRTAFAMPVPKAGELTTALTPLSDGNVAVISLQSVKPGELPSGQQLERERQQLSNAYGQSEYEALLEDLRDKAEIRISDEFSNEQS